MTFAWDELLTFGLAGAAIGFLSGVFGLGGGFLIVPVLHILLRVPMNLAVGAGACQVLGPATTSLLARRPQREHFRVPVMIFGGQLLGTFVGAGVLESAQHYGTDGAVELAGRTVPMIDLLVLSLYFILLSTIGMFAVWESRRCAADGTARGWLADFPLPPFCTPIDFERDRVSIPGVVRAVCRLSGRPAGNEWRIAPASRTRLFDGNQYARGDSRHIDHRLARGDSQYHRPCVERQYRFVAGLNPACRWNDRGTAGFRGRETLGRTETPATLRLAAAGHRSDDRLAAE